MKFICDVMLGTLAKWLRILGFDTKYSRDFEDDEILRIAEEENRIVLTRDKLLANKAKKAVYINERSLDEQIKRVLNELKIDVDEGKILTRCILCNVRVKRIEKEKVKGKVPPHVFEIHDEFWICPNCKRIYWAGTHWQNMEEKIKEISK
ncbi:MAG: Mut7-C RNAse domain-containing protein [Thermoplasmata archaeon]|nr:Mut7-C RNAse domain-containing protein [Thermoplasmata archaeon]